MNAKRKKVTAFILEQIAKFIPGDDTNVKLLGDKLNAMSDPEFESYLKKLKPVKTDEDLKNREFLPFYLPNLSGKRISIARNYQIVRDLGKSLAHRLVMTDPVTGDRYVTPHEYPVYDLPVRRQAQTVVKKRSIPEHNQRIDDLTEQPTSDSKGSRISSPEGVALLSRGLDNTMMEFAKVRGGDGAAYREFTRLLIENGEVSMADLMNLGIAKSTLTAATYFNCMHIGNNLNPATQVPDDARKGPV
jgi:hypothetical protein